MKSKENIIYFIAAIALLLTSIFSKGFHHFDEHFQLLEFANYKLGNLTISELPWEFGTQMRPSLQPLMVYLSSKGLALIGLFNPFLLAFILRLLSASLAFYAMYTMYQLYKNQYKIEKLKHWFLYLSFLLWFVIYNGVRFSSENWSALAFVFSFVFYFRWKNKKLHHYLVLGLLMGLSFQFRFQAAFMIIGFGLWMLFIGKEKFHKLIVLFLGFLIVLGLGVLSDYWLYESWTFSPWNYLSQNIFEDKASEFGVEPWYYYISKFFIQGIPPLSLLIILAVFVFCFKRIKHPISWIIIPFLLAHFVIGHKELRFLFPVVYFLPLITIESLSIIKTHYVTTLFEQRVVKVGFKLCLVANLIFLAIICFRPADPQLPLYEAVYANYKQPTILYHFGKNPFVRVLAVDFYKRKNLTIEQIESLDEIPTTETKTQLVVFGGKNRAGEIFEHNNSLVYSTFPSWIKAINFNNWQSRSKMWTVYELRED